MNAVFKALADPSRREILRLLSARPHPAGEIAELLGMAKPTLSGHLAVLKAADLVDVERQGTSLIYHLKMSVLEEAMLLFSATMGLGRHTAPGKSPPDPSTSDLAAKESP